MTFWEHVATTKWGAYVSEIEKCAILRAQALAGKPGVALEMGCEGGRWSRMLSDLGWRMVCVDISEEALTVCRQKLPEAKCILAHPADERIPVDSNSVDLLLCIEVAPVIESQWFLEEAGRVLRDGGVLVGVVLNRVSVRGVIHKAQNWIRGMEDEFYKVSYGDWRQRLCRTGLRPVIEEGLCWGPFGRSSNSPLVPLCTKLERLLGLRRVKAVSPWVVVVARNRVQSDKPIPHRPGRRQRGN